MYQDQIIDTCDVMYYPLMCDICIVMYMRTVNSLHIYSADEKQHKRRNKFSEKQTYGCGYMDVRQAKTESFTTTWGPVGFTKESHPLWIMVSHFCHTMLSSRRSTKSLLNHTGSKWCNLIGHLNVSPA